MVEGSCTCAKKSFLHLADCPAARLTSRVALEHLRKAAFDLPNSTLFYIAENISEASKRCRDEYLKSFWTCVVENHDIVTVILGNGAEITFLPESEALCLLDLPNSNQVFVEGSIRSRELMEILEHKTNKITLVDPVTKEIL
jgi:hypothetical protein